MLVRVCEIKRLAQSEVRFAILFVEFDKPVCGVRGFILVRGVFCFSKVVFDNSVGKHSNHRDNAQVNDQNCDQKSFDSDFLNFVKIDGSDSINVYFHFT